MAQAKTFPGLGTVVSTWISAELTGLIDDVGKASARSRSGQLRAIVETWAAGRDDRYVIELEDGTTL